MASIHWRGAYALRNVEGTDEYALLKRGYTPEYSRNEDEFDDGIIFGGWSSNYVELGRSKSISELHRIQIADEEAEEAKEAGESGRRGGYNRRRY